MGQTQLVTDELSPGLYETILDAALDERLGDVDSRLVRRGVLRSADASDRIAQHLARLLRRALESVPDVDRAAVGVDVLRRLLSEVGAHIPQSNADDAMPLETGETLYGIGEWRPDGSVRMPLGPLIPLLDTTLLTNAPGEPRVGQQVLREIESADAIDVVMAFVRRSGLLPLASALREHCARGRRLRILTTTYTGSTEAKALELLADLGADVRVSYDLTTTRLHAKAWVFHRRSAFSTAYVGSSNLTHSAQVAGMEWNVRVSGARNPDVIDKIEAVFESYWQGGDFVRYSADEFREAIARSGRAADSSGQIMSPVEMRLEPFQERLLELIAVSRARGHHRNLLVSATGTGKTVMAAIDYARLRAKLPRARLLFVAHREEILDQSRATFRHAMRDYAFGEKWVGGVRPAEFEHVFASVQSLSVANLEHLDPDHFDVVIIDEFHHAAAPSYQALLDRLTPQEFLGLTATPERSDGLSILHWFDDRIAAELRLWDAIEQHRLTPFAYYGIHDGTDLTGVPWRRGRGYDTTALTNVYTADDAWARHVFGQLDDHIDDVFTMRCLGFCVSVAHAQFMARHFQALGVSAVAVSGDTPRDERRDALRDLADGRVQVIFSVDLFNEGIDVPAVDVVLMLRPTESATLFLQQLGRGLRTAPNKTVCTVLDFVGAHRNEFRFDLRYRGLLGGSRRELEHAVEAGFPFLPAGCHMELDRVAQDIVLRSIQQAIPSRWPAKVAELRALTASRGAVSLADYLAETGLELTDIYAGNRCWSDLQVAAEVAVAPVGPNEAALRRGIGRMTHIDDDQRIAMLSRFVRHSSAPIAANMSQVESRVARMFIANLSGNVIDKSGSLQDAIDIVWRHPQIIAEIGNLLDVLRGKVDHIHTEAMPGVPLQVHARYTRIEILAAVGEGAVAKTPQWREGVYDSKVSGADLLAFTLDKTSGDFSPTTRYRDYAISRELIHWESQSVTRAESPTGLRYRNHVSLGRSVLLFARARTDDRAFWFLGPATYVSHEGEKPMAVTWKLQTPLPGDLFAAFAAAVA
ncbi:Superfamily II DNA or RNA helicase [Frankineae bacterium MT45]|nr:Superfamily II DNA or RNA helicase [Frankineae bacterium MT45]